MSDPDPDPDPVLEVRDLRKTFGGITAVDGASFDVTGGTVTGLIGPNGAGKTTTFDLVSGFYEPDGGEIRYRGRSLREIMSPSRTERLIWNTSAGISFGGLGLSLGALAGASTPVLAGAAGAGAVAGGAVYAGQERVRNDLFEEYRSRPFQVARAGLARTFQITRELQGLTVVENLMLAPGDQAGESLLNAWFRPEAVDTDESVVRERAEEMLDLLELDHLRGEYAGNLSGGQRKLLELGRVLMTDPDLILLDEPVAGVNPTLTRNLLDRIEDLRDQGYTFLVVEHDMEVIMSLSDVVIVMDQGSVLTEGAPEEVQQDERVIEAYLGG